MLDEPFEDRIEHGVGRKRVFIFLIFTQLCRWRPRNDVVRNDRAIRTFGAIRFPVIAQARKTKDFGLV